MNPLPKSTPARSASSAYRPDIDGLRFIAVVSVVLYHAGITVTSGGFVGVDVFFVISGYLITGIINSEIERGSFSIVKFYERRIRRIFPALFVMATITSIAAWFILMPYDFKEYGESLTAMSIFLSNVYFVLKSGYFDQTASLRPLLHTWSLAIEEQYYVFFPALLIVMHKINKNGIPIAVLFFGVLSLALGIHEVHHNSTVAFYVIWYRAWELFAGSLISLKLIPRPTKEWAIQLIAAIGLVLVLFPIFFYTKQTLFPGETALPPVVGTALIIYAGEAGPSFVSRLLSLRPLVFIGLVSYSFYLWHWPIFVFARYISGGDFPQWEGLVLALIAFGVSVLSWRFVERPFRHSKARSNPAGVRRAVNPALALGACCMLAGVCFGVSGRLGHGLPWRLPPQVSRIAMVALDSNPRRDACDSLPPSRLDHDGACRIGNPAAPITFAVIGDSFADALSPGIDAMARSATQSGYVMTRSGCAPLLGLNQGGNGACRAFVNAAFALVNRHPNITTVILIGRWTTISEGTRFGADRVVDMFVSDDETKHEGYAENRQVLERSFERSLAALSSRRVYITAFIPEQFVNVPRTMAVNRLFGTVRDVSVSRAQFDQRQQYVRALLAKLANSYKFSVIDVGALLCNSTECAAANSNGLPLYVDDVHLSRSTVISMNSMFAPAFTNQSPASADVEGLTVQKSY